METEKQDERRREIEAAAFELLAEKGYRSTSMLQIAKRAGASNQTLYAWYGNKQTLFSNIIKDNARAVNDLLDHALDEDADPYEMLRTLGPLLLRFTTGEKAIIVNRAAVTDANETGLLGEAIDRGARQNIVSKVEDVMGQLVKAGKFRQRTDPADAAESYISLLLGEVQMRQALGRLEPLSETDITARSERALELTCRLYRGDS